jgi:hypothetical protein
MEFSGLLPSFAPKKKVMEFSLKKQSYGIFLGETMKHFFFCPKN